MQRQRRRTQITNSDCSKMTTETAGEMKTSNDNSDSDCDCDVAAAGCAWRWRIKRF